MNAGPHTNFPVLISHTDPDLATAAGKVTNVNGYDIRFADNAGNPLDFQLEKYNGATGQIVAWVKIPTLTNGSNVTIQILYGNSAVMTDQSTNATWSSGYNGVWHFNNNVNDVSGSGITSVNNGSTNQAAGKIGDARNFVRPNHWVELTNFGNLNTNFTITGWINPSDVTQADQRIFADDVNNTGGYSLSLGDGGSGRLRFFARGTTPVSLDVTSLLMVNNTWYHIAAVADVTGNIKRIYINGVERVNGAITGTWGTDAGNASIGGETAAGETGARFSGNLDEIRVANRALSAGWLATEYASQNQPTTTVGVTTPGDFYTVGSEVLYGNPAEFGNNLWNAYAYNGNDANNSINTYQGFYQHNTLNFKSTSLWGINASPSAAAGYIGCTVANDIHTVRYKRRGFPCGYYQIDIAGHDDNADLYIDGVSVWVHNGCCDIHNNVWAGYMGPNTTVEFRWRENAGESYGRVNFTTLPHPTLTPPVTICAGSSTTLTASGAASYDWSTNTTHLVAPYTNPSVVVSPPGATPNSTQNYTVRTTDATTGCTVSNSVLVTINPLPSTAVTPTTGNYCVTGTINATATGANTYTWSPAAGVTVTSPSGHTADLSPAVTTTYTVTGNNNCASNSATVTVTVNNPTGDPTIFGNNQWNVYAYGDNNFTTYQGSYTQNSLDFDTRLIWNQNTSPSNAPGYVGCTIANDNHSYRYKRKGFPCGYYQLNVPAHDDYAEVFINGVSVWVHNGCCDAHTNIWSGYLDANSEIDFALREFGGGSYGNMTFNYLYGPQNSATQAVWGGVSSSDWFTTSNWCGSVPSPTISAYLPSGGVAFQPAINSGGAQILDLTILNGATLTVANGQSLASYGNWTNNGTFSPATNSTVVFTGTNASILSGSSTTTFANAQLNNSNPASLTLARDMNINGNFTFTNGYVVTGANNVIFNDNATASGMSNASYVSGNARKVGDDAFTFPVGRSGYYAPIAISAPDNVAYYFTASYTFADPDASGYTASAVGTGVNHVSRCEYWILDRNPGPSSDETVTLSWGTPRSCGVTNLSELLVSGWSGAQWTNWGNGSTSGNTTTGSVTSNAVSSFGVFTLASSTTNNPLPIELVTFDAIFKQDHIEISWKTATETNNDYFTIEKSLDGLNWHILSRQKGAGNSLVPLTYSLNDTSPNTGLQYYRLKQTDFNGTSTLSNIISVLVDESLDQTRLIVYPNPTDEFVTIKVISVEQTTANVRITNSAGQVVQQGTLKNSQITFSMLTLPKGMYMVEVLLTDGILRSKLMHH